MYFKSALETEKVEGKIFGGGKKHQKMAKNDVVNRNSPKVAEISHLQVLFPFVFLLQFPLIIPDTRYSATLANTHRVFHGQEI